MSKQVKFKYFTNKQSFLNDESNSAGDVNFIADSKEIVTHDRTYKSVNWSVLEPYVPTSGVWIYDLDGDFITPSDWDTSNNSKAVGVAVLGDNCRFVVAKEDIGSKYWVKDSYHFIDIEGVLTTTSSTEAAKDFDGVTNTRLIIEALGVGNALVAEACASYSFLNGQTGYLGAAGEWKLARSYKDELNSALELIGGTKMTESSYWTSTEYSSSIAWSQLFGSGSSLEIGTKIGNGSYVRAFLAL